VNRRLTSHLIVRMMPKPARARRVSHPYAKRNGGMVVGTGAPELWPLIGGKEGPPSWWHWTIYPGAGPDVIGETKYRSREAAVAACIKEINNGIERSRHARARAFRGSMISIRRGGAWCGRGRQLRRPYFRAIRALSFISSSYRSV
jgi:hypothetical protein